MPGMSKHLKPKKRQGTAGRSEKKEEQRSKKKKSNRSDEIGSSLEGRPESRGARSPARGRIELEVPFEDDSEVEMQVIYLNDLLIHNQGDSLNLEGTPTFALTDMYEWNNFVELELIDLTYDPPHEVKANFEGGGGLQLPSLADLLRMFDGDIDVELEIINPNVETDNEDSDDYPEEFSSLWKKYE